MVSFRKTLSRKGKERNWGRGGMDNIFLNHPAYIDIYIIQIYILKYCIIAEILGVLKGEGQKTKPKW